MFRGLAAIHEGIRQALADLVTDVLALLCRIGLDLLALVICFFEGRDLFFSDLLVAVDDRLDLRLVERRRNNGIGIFLVLVGAFLDPEGGELLQGDRGFLLDVIHRKRPGLELNRGHQVVR